MPSTTSPELVQKIFRNLNTVNTLAKIVLELPAASRIDESELHLAATLWCSRMRDMPFDATEDSKIVAVYLRRVLDLDERAFHPIDRQQVEGGIKLYQDLQTLVSKDSGMLSGMAWRDRHKTITGVCEILRVTLSYPEAPTDFVPRRIAGLTFAGGIDGVFVSPRGADGPKPMVPIADIECRLFPVTANAASQCDESEALSLQGSSLLNTPTTHRRTDGPGDRGVATPHSDTVDDDGEALCGFSDSTGIDPDCPQELSDPVSEGAPDDRGVALVTGGRTLFDNGTILEADAPTRTQNEVDGSTETLYQPSLAPPPTEPSVACASTLATQHREAHCGASTDVAKAHNGASTDTVGEMPRAGPEVVVSSTAQSRAATGSALTLRAGQAVQRAAPAGCCVDADGTTRLLPIYLLVPSDGEQANRNGHSYYVVARGEDPDTLNEVTGIFDGWEASKKYHHRVKGRGTEQFALPTLIEAQCKLFNVLHKGMDVDGSAFYAAAGGIGGGQPPVALTEGTAGPRKKTRGRDSKSGGSSSKRPPKVDLTNIHSRPLLPPLNDNHRPQDDRRKRSRSVGGRSRSASPGRRGRGSGGTGKRRSRDRGASRDGSPRSNSRDRGGGTGKRRSRDRGAGRHGSSRSGSRDRGKEQATRGTSSTSRTDTPRPEAAASARPTPSGSGRANFYTGAVAAALAMFGGTDAALTRAASVTQTRPQRESAAPALRLRHRTAHPSSPTALSDMLAGPTDAL